jgi:hypothetical protein
LDSIALTYITTAFHTTIRMKLLTLLPLLATTVFASTDSSTSSASAADPASSGPAAASAPPAEDPTPVGALWTAAWNETTLKPYTPSCASRSTYHGAIYKLASLYPDLETFAPQLKIFYNKQLYPGSWSGIDLHGGERELIKMDLSELPWKVREWIKKESTQRHYSVHDDVVFFAPGAIYPILPLWVDSEVGGCEGMSD